MLDARTVDLAADRPVWLIGDGELPGRLPATVSVEPASLTVVSGYAIRATGVRQTA